MLSVSGCNIPCSRDAGAGSPRRDRAIDEYLRLTARKSGQFIFSGHGDGTRAVNFTFVMHARS